MQPGTPNRTETTGQDRIPEQDRIPKQDRNPKQDRSRATRRRLLEAAVACLAEHGWSGSTVTVVAKRAGVSRGAAQHHFPTREDLFTAAVEHVAERRSAALRAVLTGPDQAPGTATGTVPGTAAGTAAGTATAAGATREPGAAAGTAPDPTTGTAESRTRAVVEAIVGLYTGPLFRAALQLWVAASNEEPLRSRVTALEARVGRESHRMAVELLGADESVPGVRETVQGLLDMARGLGLATLLTDDTARRERVVAQWAGILDATLP